MARNRSTDRPAFLVRILALLVDYVLILGWMAVLGVLSLLLYLATGQLYNWLELGAAGAQLLGFAVLVLPVALYLYFSESSAHQATAGKRTMKLQVADHRTGGRPGRRQILVRTVIKLLPWEIAHFSAWHIIAFVSAGGGHWPPWLLAVAVFADVLPFIYILVVAVHFQGRGPHDLVAGTRVVTRASS